jgi:hypothetical protein
MGRCKNCNKIFWSLGKKTLLADIFIHGAEAHHYKYEYEVWVIKNVEYRLLQENAHNRHFWEGFNGAFRLTH